MNNFAVMGSPIAHSLSPTLHEAGFRYCGVQASYKAIEVKSLSKNQAMEYAGLSLTMPLKLDACAMADDHDEDSLLTGVSNTLLTRGEKIKALNTDVYGVRKSLETLDCESVLVVGTGATAKSAALALRERVLSFSGRNEEKVSAIRSWAEGLNIKVGKRSKYDVVIDTTAAEAIPNYPEHHWIMDVAYGSERNKKSPNLISGLEMLLHQAVIQNLLFSQAEGKNGIDLAELTDAMREALVARVGEWSNA